MKTKDQGIIFQVYSDQEMSFQFHEGLSVFFGLAGESRIFCGSHQYELLPAGILAVNPFEVHRLLCPAGASVLCLCISRSILNLVDWKYGRGCFCYTRSGRDESAKYRKIKELTAVIFQYYIEDPDSPMLTSTAMQMLNDLQLHFAAEGGGHLQRESGVRRLKNILDRIHGHWNEDISLSEIAQQEFLSVGYLSRFLHKYLNMNFSQYLKELRLSHSLQMLKQDHLTVAQISYECGFRTSSAFIEAFKQQYGQTPGQFRQMRQSGQEQQQSAPLPQDAPRNDMTALLDYLPKEKTAEVPGRMQQVIVKCAGQPPKASAPWRRILNIGYARDGLLSNVQEQIRRAQKEIGFEFIRFHGLLDSDMHIYSESAQGSPRFFFAYVDMLFDFILSAGLKPYVELSFMPSQLAREQTRIFDRPSVISGCTDLVKWGLLVRAVICHLIRRYGGEEVRRWRFTTISQNYVHLGCVRWDDYQNLYEAARRAVKESDEQLLFGGPGCFPELIEQENGMSAFLDFARDRDCLPDFIAFQFYPHIYTSDPLFMAFTLSQQSAPAILSEDRDYLIHSLDKLDDLLARHGLSDREIYLEESTSTLWQRDLSSDTCYKAAWLAKNICDSHGRAVFGYWLLTDLLEERAPLEDVYHGGYGLFTYNGIPKAGYHAMRVISRMGSEVIDSGRDWMLTRRGGDYQLLAYNYCHYSNIYRYRYKKLERPEDAYSVFEQGESIHLQLGLLDLPQGKYRMERWKITRKDGSSFDKWMEIGSPRYPSGQELSYLIETSQPSYRAEEIRVHEEMHIEVLLHPLEVEFLYFHAIGTVE